MKQIGIRNDTLYIRLGVSRIAASEEIKRAYYRKAHECHPDHGGDEEVFKELFEAYQILRDPVKRKKYDETGQWLHMQGGISEEYVSQQKAVGFIGGVFSNLLRQHEERIIYVNVIEVIHGAIEKETRNYKSQVSEIKKLEKNLLKVIKKIKYRGDLPNIMEGVIFQKCETLRKRLEATQKEVEYLQLAKKILKEYVFDFQPDQSIRFTLNFSNMTSTSTF